MSAASLRYVVFGAGAVGSALGGHLSRAGEEVVLVGRRDHVDRISAEGLRLSTASAEHVVQVPAVSAAREVDWRPSDVVMLCVKSQHTATALQEIREAGADTETVPIVCFQNSISNEPAAVRYFARVYGVMAVVSVIYLSEGAVYDSSSTSAGWLELGAYPTGEDALAEDVVAALKRASYDASVRRDVMVPKAAKLLDNLSNAYGAITDQYDDGPYLAEARREGEEVLRADGVEWEDLDAFRSRARSHQVKPANAPPVRNLGSTWQSLTRRQGSIEVDFLNGEIVRRGRRRLIPTPYNTVLQQMANEMALRQEAPGKYSGEHLLQKAMSRAAQSAADVGR